MKTIGIICEYNPFHTGHLHHINSARSEGDTVICLMSGNFTQRGEPAIADKFKRARAAVASGADLVLELPFPFSSASADYFAGAGVAILDELLADEINFGSESADREGLLSLARASATPEFDEEYKKMLDREPTLGAAQAYFRALSCIGGEALPSNDMLGLAYFRAALRIGCEEKLRVTKRDGADYGEKKISGKSHPSATAVRVLMLDGDARAFELMPPPAAKALQDANIANAKNLERAILAFFRLADPCELEKCAEAGGGLAHRLVSAAKRSCSLEEFFESAAAKRYTDSRVRRAVLFCMLSVTPEDLTAPPAYLQLLAANEKGRAELARIKKRSHIKIVTKPADAEKISPRQFALSARADALYTLAFDTPHASDEYVKSSPTVI